MSQELNLYVVVKNQPYGSNLRSNTSFRGSAVRQHDVVRDGSRVAAGLTGGRAPGVSGKRAARGFCH